MSDTLTDVEITILNAARGILREQSKHAYDATPSEVRTAVEAEKAEYAIFQFLSVTNAYMHREMSYEQLHNATQPVPAPESLRA